MAAVAAVMMIVIHSRMTCKFVIVIAVVLLAALVFGLECAKDILGKSVGVCSFLDGSWDLTKYYLITLGKPQHSIRCTCVVDDQLVWCGYRNKVHIVNPAKLALEVE